MTRSRPAAASACAVRARPSALVVSDDLGRGSSAVRAPHDVDQPAAQQRLAAGEPHLADAEPLDARSSTSRTTSSSVSTSLGRAASRGPRPACSRCSAGCSGRSARRAGRWRRGRSGPPGRVVTIASLPTVPHHAPVLRTRPDSLAGCGRCGSCSADAGSLFALVVVLPGLGRVVARRVAVPPARRPQGHATPIVQRQRGPRRRPRSTTCSPPAGRSPTADEWRRGRRRPAPTTPSDTVVVRYRTRDGAVRRRRRRPAGHRRRHGAAGRPRLDGDRQPAAPTATTCPRRRTGEVTVTGWVRARRRPATAPRSPTSPPGRSPAREIGEALGPRGATAASSTSRAEDARAGDAAASRSSCPSSTTGRTSSTACSGGSSALLAIFGFCYLRLRRVARRPRGATGAPAPEPTRTGKASRPGRDAVRARAADSSGSGERLRGRGACRRRPGSIAPVTKDAAGDSRKAATRPNSSGSP